jgi:hypothetical protein
MGSLKGLAMSTAWSEMLSCKLLSIAAAFVPYMLWWKLPMPNLMPELWGMECSRMPLPGSRISATYLFKNKLKALNT